MRFVCGSGHKGCKIGLLPREAHVMEHGVQSAQTRLTVSGPRSPGLRLLALLAASLASHREPWSPGQSGSHHIPMHHTPGVATAGSWHHHQGQELGQRSSGRVGRCQQAKPWGKDSARIRLIGTESSEAIWCGPHADAVHPQLSVFLKADTGLITLKTHLGGRRKNEEEPIDRGSCQSIKRF